MTVNVPRHLAVCSWSLQPVSADDLFRKLDETGIHRVQIALDPIRENAGGAWDDFPDRCAQHGVTCVSGMFTTLGEDYTTPETIRRTGGVVPDETWEANWRRIQRDADLAQWLGLKLVTFHAGFLPHEQSDPNFARLLERIQRIANLCISRDLTLGLETGQETAATLKAFISKLQCANVGVNFDPANMLLYDKGDPVAALRALGPWLRQVHIKDARRPRTPGAWGEEVAVGTGEVDWPAFFQTLAALHFSGHCCIEREAGSQRVADIRTAWRHVEKFLA
jgi:sugar phosphate isomerase/epimerase